MEMSEEEIVCPNCGHVYLPSEAIQIVMDGGTVLACPECGSMSMSRVGEKKKEGGLES